MGTRTVDAHLEVVAAAGEVVDDADTMAPSRQVEGGGPTQIAVATENQNVHVVSPSRSGKPSAHPSLTPPEGACHETSGTLYHLTPWNALRAVTAPGSVGTARRRLVARIFQRAPACGQSVTVR